MVSESNPTLYVEYSLDDINYTDLMPKVSSFNVKDSGIYKTAQAEVVLFNKPNGYYTSPNPPLQNNAYLRIRADVRGTIDTIFKGKTKIKQSESSGKKEYLTVTARGRLNVLLQDYKTYDYGDDVLNGIEDWTLETALIDAFMHPDSTHDCGLALTINGSGLNVAMKQNFDRKTLLEAVQAMCEYATYCGWDDLSQATPTLHLEPIGTTLTNPLVEIPAEPLERTFDESIDDLYNHVLVKASPNPIIPSYDAFCEGGYAAGYWTGLGNTVVSDESSIFAVGTKSIKALNSTDPFSNPAQAKLSIPPTVDCNALSILGLFFHYYWKSDTLSSTSNSPSVTLIDTNGKQISMTFPKEQPEKWKTVTAKIASLTDNGLQFEPINPESYMITGDGFWFGDADFNWVIRYITFSSHKIVYTGTYVQCNIDGLYFDTAISTDPTVNTALQVYDNTSIAKWGRNVLNVDAPELQEYAFIVPYGNSILSVTKNPIVKLKIKHGAKTWARVGQTVSIPSMPAYRIWDYTTQTYIPLTNWYGRIVDLEFDYEAATKMLHSTFTLTPRYQPITSKEWYKGMLDGIIRCKVW
jgi:hypothetical protein